ncbi:MAG: hypothetical protein ACLFVN_10540 [Phycisphaeraceae bacterium]
MQIELHDGRTISDPSPARVAREVSRLTEPGQFAVLRVGEGFYVRCMREDRGYRVERADGGAKRRWVAQPVPMKLGQVVKLMDGFARRAPRWHKAARWRKAEPELHFEPIKPAPKVRDRLIEVKNGHITISFHWAMRFCWLGLWALGGLCIMFFPDFALHGWSGGWGRRDSPVLWLFLGGLGCLVASFRTKGQKHGYRF